MDEIIEYLRQKLTGLADEATRRSSQSFFKEPILTYGVKVPLVNSIAKEAIQLLKPESKKTVFALCTSLWQSGYFEESILACNLAYSRKKEFEPTDFLLFENWLTRYVANWASCDTLCNHTIGDFLERFPTYIGEMKRWAASENRWQRRAAAVSLIIPARKGKFLPELLEIASLLLTDTDDLVQKGYGWMLKAACAAHEAAIFDFVMNNKATMPRTALRYAIEKMPDELRKQAMAR